MARILMGVSNTLHINGQPAMYCFYEQLLQALKEAGNHVLVYHPFEFHEKEVGGYNVLREEIDEEKLIDDIQQFDPDFVLAFNNVIYRNILGIVDCPIIIWDSDLYWYWCQPDILQNNIERYTFFCSFREHCNEVKRYFHGIEDKQVFYIPFGTSVKAEEKEYTHNISFIGTLFIPDYSLESFIDCKNKSVEETFDTFELVFNMVKKNPLLTKNEILEECISIKESPAYDFLQLYPYVMNFSSWFSGESRLLFLQKICSLGLTIYGSIWEELIVVMPTLLTTLNRQFVYSLEHNQDIYNNSKICFNIMHKQAVYGYSWRVHDIMASNGCLVSEKSDVIRQRFSKYVDIPMFETPAEAYDICKKLLDDETWRRDIVLGCQEAIRQEYTWDNVLERMQDILGNKYNIIGEGELKSEGSVELLRAKKIENTEKLQESIDA